MLPRKRQDLPSSWETTIVRLHMFSPTPAGLLAPDHYGVAAWPLVCEQQRLPRKVFRRSIAWLSDSLRAPCAAWSASRCRLPVPHARLASSRWSDATGRAFHPQGSIERFQSCFLTSHPPLPSFAWHNVINPSGGCGISDVLQNHPRDTGTDYPALTAPPGPPPTV